MATGEEGAGSDLGLAEATQVRPPLPLLTLRSLRNYYRLGYLFAHANNYAITP